MDLLPDRTLVESQLLSLQNVTIRTTALAGPGRDDGVQTTGLELALQRRLDLAVGGVSRGLLLLNALALLGLGGTSALSTSLLLASATQRLAVVRLVPLSERRSVDLHHGRLGQRVGPDQLVVRRVVHHPDHAGLARNPLGSPREVARVQTQRAVLGVTTPGPHKVDALGADTRVGRLTTLLEGSAGKIPLTLCPNPLPMAFSSICSVVPLLAVLGALRSASRALVTGITRNTHVGGLWTGPLYTVRLFPMHGRKRNAGRQSCLFNV